MVACSSRGLYVITRLLSVLCSKTVLEGVYSSDNTPEPNKEENLSSHR